MHRRVGHSNYDGKIAGLYDLEETLGSGHFAVVKLARHVFTGEKVAVKVIDKSKLDEISRAHLFQEVRCMKLVQHPNVVRLYEVIDTQTKLYLILELGDGGDLYDYIMRHDQGLTEQLARTYFRQIVKAISYCHRLHVVHRDLKPENVVFFEKLGLVKLTDFGFSNRFCPGQKLETSCGSLAYSAPEILLGDSYDAPAVDVWSLGVILYMLVCGHAPFQEANDSETLTMIMDCKYSIPPYVSDECKQLIARMLVREPERRATLDEIAEDPWLLVGSEMDPVIETLPLVSRHQVSEEHHSLIITKMVNGNIATKEEILEALDKNEYNHITATYFLLAERKLRASRQEPIKGDMNHSARQVNTLSSNDNCVDKKTIGINNALLTVPRIPEVGQNTRTRKCSIVQEEEDEDDVSSGKDERGSNSALNAFNRRGSRSEGKLSHVLQERLSHLPEKPLVTTKAPPARHEANEPVTHHEKDNKTELINKQHIQETKTANTEGKSSLDWNSTQASAVGQNKRQSGNATFLTESSTAPTPLRTTNVTTAKDCQLLIPKYKTMPPPSNTNGSQKKTSSPPQLTLNEILEDCDASVTDPSLESTSGHVVKSQVVIRRTGYEQRRSKFHKTRTTSCSSSDASDDDSENRKKRAHKIGSSGKPLPRRRDSHDDSSDSQDPSGTSGGGGNGTQHNFGQKDSQTNDNTREKSSGGSNNTGGEGKSKDNGGGGNEAENIAYGRRHRAGRRRTGETRLRESQSLNRITEVQEAEPHVARAAVTATPSVPLTSTKTDNTMTPKSRSLGARLLQGWSKSAILATVKSSEKDAPTVDESKVNRGDCKSSRKMRLLSRYFAVHKKLCVPLPGFFGKGRLYKARSCGNIVKERTSPKCVLHCEDKWREQRRRHWSHHPADINQNLGPDVGLSNICHVHLGTASKCSGLC